MKKQLFLLFSVLLGYSELSFAYDPTRGALQNAPELRIYGYNQQDIYNKYHPSVNIGNSYNNNGNSYNNNGNSYNNNGSSYNNTNPVIVNLPSKYGAVAYSQKAGIISDSGNEDSLKQAKRVAIQKCEKVSSGESCKIYTWIRNGCLAVATGKKNGVRTIFRGYFSTEGNSERLALENCSSEKYKECAIIVPERCSLPTPLF